MRRLLAGIAASDVICCASLAKHPKGDNHTEAVGLLRTVDKDAALVEKARRAHAAAGG